MKTFFYKGRGIILSYCIGILIGEILLVAVNSKPGFPLGGPGDFTAFYTAAQIFTSGDAEHLYDLKVQAETQHELLLAEGLNPNEEIWSFYYPPIATIPFLPMASLALRYGFLIWYALNLAMLTLSLCLVLGCWGKINFQELCCILLFALSFFPVFTCLQNGQTSIMALLILSIACRAMHQGNHYLAGAALGFLCAKPQLVFGFFIWLLLSKKWRSMVGFLLISFISVIASWLMVGNAGIGKLFTLIFTGFEAEGALPNVKTTGMPNIMGSVHKLSSLLSRLFTEFPNGLFEAILAAAFTIIVLIMLYRVLGRLSNGLDLQIGSAIIASLLIAPHLHGHDLTLLCLAGFVIAHYCTSIGFSNGARNLLLSGHIGINAAWIFLPLPWASQLVAILLFCTLLWLYRSKHIANNHQIH